jgi:hypothetical protein
MFKESMKVRMIVQDNNEGLFPEHTSIAPVIYEARVTPGVMAALRYAGATVSPLPFPSIGHEIILGDKMPTGIVAVHLNEPPWLGLRLDTDPEYPDEYPDFWGRLHALPGLRRSW